MTCFYFRVPVMIRLGKFEIGSEKGIYTIFLQGIEYGCNMIPYRTARIGNGELI